MAVTVLVVDDDPVIVQLLQVTFELEGHDVLTAPDGPAALARVRERRPDVVVTDVMMPEMSGLALLTDLKGDPATAGIPVLVLTARAQASDVESGQAAGADDYVTKPFDPIDLVDRVARLAKG